MILIVSNTKIKGLEGVYAAIGLVGEVDISMADVVYTENKRVIEIANRLGVEVRDFPKHPPSINEEPKEEKEKDIIQQPENQDVLIPINLEDETPKKAGRPKKEKKG